VNHSAIFAERYPETRSLTQREGATIRTTVTRQVGCKDFRLFMASRIIPSWIRARIDFVADEPGTLLILFMVASWLLFFPGGACGIDEASMPSPPEDHGHDEAAPH
jgi:hypothetical protein